MMGMDKNKSINKWIDINALPIKISKHGNQFIDWENSIGCKLKFVYGAYSGELEILDKSSNSKYEVCIYTSNEKLYYFLSTDEIRNCQLGGIFKKPIAITHPDLIKYFVNKDDAYKYSANSNKKVEMICPICGTEKVHQISLLTKYGLACPMCSDGVSYPEKLMFNILTQLKVDFKNQVTKATPGFEWILGNYRYDFYINLENKKFLLEMDGAFHNGSSFHSYEEVHHIDAEKDNIANCNGFSVIRIDCDYGKIEKRFEYIKNNILNSELSNLLDFSNVDWNMANEFAINSNVKLAAELWNNGALGTSIIGEKLGVSKDTAKGYLKIASSLNMCNYSNDEINRRMLIQIDKNNKKKRKPISVMYNNIVIGVFMGTKELDEQSIQLFGKHLDFRNVSAVCYNKRKQAYGYRFEFISQEKYEYYYQLFGGNMSPYYQNENIIYHNARARAKPVMLIDNNKIIGVFKSAKELEIQSLELIGTKLSYSNINKVCNGQMKHTKGFVIRRITNEEYNYYYKLFGINNTKLL